MFLKKKVALLSVLFYILLISLQSFSGGFDSISDLSVSMKSTMSSDNYIESLPNNEKSLWKQNLPDSIKLNMNVKLKVPSGFSGKVWFQIGKEDGANDIFKGSYNLSQNSSPEGVVLSTHNEFLIFNLGELQGLKDFTVICWLETSEGTNGPVIKYHSK